MSARNPGEIQKGYGILDLSGTLVEINKKYSIDFFVKNVLGQHFRDEIFPIGAPVAPGGYLQILDKYASEGSASHCATTSSNRARHDFPSSFAHGENALIG